MQDVVIVRGQSSSAGIGMVAELVPLLVLSGFHHSI